MRTREKLNPTLPQKVVNVSVLIKDVLPFLLDTSNNILKFPMVTGGVLIMHLINILKFLYDLTRASLIF
jgi:hypothetical protein